VCVFIISSNQQGRKKTVTVTMQCCHGFARKPPAGVCEKVDLRSIEETAEKLGCTQFIKSALGDNDLKELMEGQNLTIFMSADERFMEFSQHLTDNNLVVAPLQSRDRRQSGSSYSMKDVLLNHMVKGWINIEDIDNEQTFETQYDNTTIRMNVFPKIYSNRRQDDGENYRYLYTANCVPIIKINKFATNGVVHMVKNVLMPVKQYIMEFIRSREDMTVLRTVLEKTKMDKVLEGLDSEDDDEEASKKNVAKQFSIFAPTDRAFEKLDPQLKRKLKEGAACAESKWINYTRCLINYTKILMAR